MTDRYAVIGNPVAHSKSPEIHALFARQTGQDIEYVRLAAPLDGFRATVQAFVAQGGRGANVTVPFKLEAFDLAHEVSARAKDARAANFLKFEGGRISADNTDGYGLVRDITINLGVTLAAKRVLLMGAGGAAQGVLIPLLQERPAILTIVNRTPDKALRLAETTRHHPAAEHSVISGIGYPDLAGKHFDIVINATSSSLSDALPPLPNALFAAGALAYEMVYGKGPTPFLAFAKAQGAQVLADGLGMLVEQAAESFRLWRGVLPQTRPVIEALRAN
ncbi:MAG TPA: shikimate dehydrogenase [Burkholderiales bacterium]|jgi:shikimate dehydrogenase|nr:shikimate dehydrogenase [Burkholderiales bacterium]